MACFIFGGRHETVDDWHGRLRWRFATLGLPHDVSPLTLWMHCPACRQPDCAHMRFWVCESWDAARAFVASAGEDQRHSYRTARSQRRPAVYNSGTDDGRSADHSACDGECMPRDCGWAVRRYDERPSRKNEGYRSGGVDRCADACSECRGSAAADVSRGGVQCGWAQRGTFGAGVCGGGRRSAGGGSVPGGRVACRDCAAVDAGDEGYRRSAGETRRLERGSAKTSCSEEGCARHERCGRKEEPEFFACESRVRRVEGRAHGLAACGGRREGQR